jgi:hypothetical protein
MGGVNWSALFAAIPAAGTAVAIGTALTPILGSPPTIANNAGVYSISFSPDQEDVFAAWLVTQLNSDPVPVQMDLGGVAIKVITRKYWPWVLGVAGAGFVLGRVMGK